MTAFRRTFPPDPGQLPGVRAALRAWLDDVGVDGEDVISDVLVVSSELVTNGVLHDGGDMITLRVNKGAGYVSIEVTTVDHLPGRHPTYRDVEESDDGGRGLAIVRALSRGYAVVRRERKRATTCRITTSVLRTVEAVTLPESIDLADVPQVIQAAGRGVSRTPADSEPTSRWGELDRTYRHPTLLQGAFAPGEDRLEANSPGGAPSRSAPPITGTAT